MAFWKKQTLDTSPEKSLDSGLMSRLRNGLRKTRDFLNTDIETLFTDKNAADADIWENLEELLITADIGVQTSMEIIERLSRKSPAIADASRLKAALQAELGALLAGNVTADAPPAADVKPRVVMVLGVNGVGKTTTIGKLAAKSVSEGKKVLIAAADTFRAAAIEQLDIWAQRAGAQIVKHKENSDPAAVAFDALEAAMARGVDIVYVDTAGRLHTKVNLMEELRKIQRTLAKKMPGAPHENLLVLDATTGQNALAQAKLFNEALGVSGLVMTKLDGTAKGGIVVSICGSLQIPLLYVGVGESITDLQIFDPDRFVAALF